MFSEFFINILPADFPKYLIEAAISIDFNDKLGPTGLQAIICFGY